MSHSTAGMNRALALFALLALVTPLLGHDDHYHRPWCPRSITLAIGVYTFQTFVPNSAGEGVTLATLTRDGFKTKLIGKDVTGENPSYCAEGRYGALYCVNENGEGSLTRIDRNGKNMSTPTNAGGSTHLAVISRWDGEVIVVANFGGAVSAHFYKYGKLTTTDTHVIPQRFAAGTEFPQEAPHPHHILPWGRYRVMVTDLGSDILWDFHVDGRGKLHRRGGLRTKKNDGPRHSVRGRRGVYIVNEVANTVTRKLTRKSFPIADGKRREDGGNTAAAIRATRDGRFLYASLRREGTAFGSVAGWRLRRDGSIGKRVGVFSSGGVHPRDFFIIERAPDCHSYIAVVNRDSNNLVLFRRNRWTGVVAAKPTYSLKVVTPTSVLQLRRSRYR